MCLFVGPLLGCNATTQRFTRFSPCVRCVCVCFRPVHSGVCPHGWSVFSVFGRSTTYSVHLFQSTCSAYDFTWGGQSLGAIYLIVCLCNATKKYRSLRRQKVGSWHWPSPGTWWLIRWCQLQAVWVKLLLLLLRPAQVETEMLVNYTKFMQQSERVHGQLMFTLYCITST